MRNQTKTKCQQIREALLMQDIPQHQRGESLGYEWACDEATAEQVIRAAAAGVIFWERFDAWEADAYGPAVNLACFILDDVNGFDRRDGELFWQKLDDDIDDVYEDCTGPFLEGFVQGALRYVDHCVTFKV